MKTLKLCWLGLPIVQIGKRLIKLETRKAMALLAYLSLSPHGSSREILATMFWPDYDQQHALANLRRILSSLVTVLPPDTLEADRYTIRWRNPAERWVDVEDFHRALKKVNAHCADELCGDCMRTLEQAAALYRGEFLESLNLKDSPEFDDWQTHQRQDHQQVMAGILERLAEEHARRSQFEQGLGYARRWVDLDRLHEPALRCLLRLLLQSGQRNEARREYEEFSRVMRDQIRQQPEEETLSIYGQIEGATVRQPGVATPFDASISIPIIKTKLYIPTPITKRVKRIRLLDLLDRAQEKALTVISAPAGSGKTTLLAEWIAHSHLPIAWLSLDHGDNDPYRFLSYLISALEGIHEDIGRDARKFLQAIQPVLPHIIIDSLITDLGAISAPSALVLDDYQFINTHQVHEVVNYFLDHLPSHLHLVVATRSDPPFHLARLRASDRVLEIRATDIRFSFDEAMLFLNEVMGLHLSIGGIEALEARTEGWVVGLKMAALSLEGKTNPDELIKTFSGSNRFILDYLVEEVIQQQPERIQKFLLYTSILDRMCGELCGKILNKAIEEAKGSGLSGSPTNQEILEHLEESNLFVVPLDDERRWYRYHHLFADLLRSSLGHRRPGILPDLHDEASRWYESEGLLEEAIHHALAATNYDRAASLIIKISENVWLNGEYYKLLRWLKAFPEERVQDYPWLCLRYAWSLTQTGPLQEARSWINAAEQAIRIQMQKDPSTLQNKIQALDQEIVSLRIALASLEGDHEKVLELALPAIDQPIQKSHLSSLMIRGSILHGLSSSYYAAGELSKTEHMCQETARVTGEIGYLIRYIPAYNKLAHVYKVTGRLHQSEQILLEQLDQMRLRGMGEHYTMGNLYCRLADLYYEWNRLDDAQQMLDKCHEYNQAVQLPYLLVDHLHVESRLLMVQKDFDGAQKCLSRAAQLIQKYYTWPQLVWENESYQGRLWYVRGDRKDAFQWCTEHPQPVSGKILFSQESIEISRAHILLGHGVLDQALDLLHQLEESANAGGRYARLIEILVVKAVVLKEKGDSEEAQGTLIEALDQARTEEYIRTFVDEGELVKEMIQEIQENLHWHKRSNSQSQIDSYLGQLIQAFSPDPISGDPYLIQRNQ